MIGAAGVALASPGESEYAALAFMRDTGALYVACHLRASRAARHPRRGPAGRQDQQTKRRLRTVRTFSPKDSDITRRWHVVDASDVVLGRLASHVAVLLRGKHKPIFAPHVDTGDFVIVVNAAKVALTGTKLQDKHAYRHSGYPGGLRAVSYASLMATSPERVVEKAVRGMLPKNSLGRKTLTKLKVYAGPDHPHQAQQPQPYEITQIEQ
jgi:large subunit ribosomal protein L13